MIFILLLIFYIIWIVSGDISFRFKADFSYLSFNFNFVKEFEALVIAWSTIALFVTISKFFAYFAVNPTWLNFVNILNFNLAN